MRPLHFIRNALLICALWGTSASAQTPAGGQSPGAAADGQRRVPIQVMNMQQAVQAGVAQVAAAPFEPLTEVQQQYLDQVLDVWEKRTAEVQRYQCEFTRWEYEPTMHPTAPTRIAKGVLKFAAPDKGLFRVDESETIVDKSPNPKYAVNPEQRFGEYWICDGEWIHDLDRNQEKATKTQLPPELRGKQIYLSPLPFLFGVKASEIKQRYWVRTVAPPEGSEDVWVEAFPKSADDSGNYSRVQVVLDRSTCLPTALIVFLPNWRPGQEHREIYQFSKQVTNWSFLNILKQKLFLQEFIPTKLPSSWRVIVQPYIPPQNAAPNGANPQQRVAVPPARQPQQR